MKPPTVTASITVDVAANLFREALARVRRAELDRGLTLVGPHRDDLVLDLNGMPARGYASHGESWSFALSLKLASAQVLRRESQAGDPVLMLDDVFAELDESRRERLADAVAGYEQVLITAAVFGDVPERLAGTVVRIRAGAVVAADSAAEPASASKSSLRPSRIPRETRTMAHDDRARPADAGTEPAPRPSRRRPEHVAVYLRFRRIFGDAGKRSANARKRHAKPVSGIPFTDGRDPHAHRGCDGRAHRAHGLDESSRAQSELLANWSELVGDETASHSDSGRHRGGRAHRAVRLHRVGHPAAAHAHEGDDRDRQAIPRGRHPLGAVRRAQRPHVETRPQINSRPRPARYLRLRRQIRSTGPS